MPDLNAASLEAAIKTVEGTARSMGLEVDGVSAVAVRRKACPQCDVKAPARS